MVNAYITNNGSNVVSVIDTATNTVIQTLNASGWGVAVTPDGTAVWVCQGNVLIFDTATGAQTGISPIATGLVSAHHVAISPDGTMAIISDDGGSATLVHVFNAKTGVELGYSPVTVGSNPWGIAISPDSSRAFVACRNTDYVYVFDTATGHAASYSPVLVGPNPNYIALSPDGATAFVTVSDSITSNTVVAFDTATGAAKSFSPITVGNAPEAITVSASGNAYVANFQSNSISVFSTSTGIAASYSPISLGSSSPGPSGISLTPDGAALYVANENTNVVSVVSTSLHTVTATIPVGVEPVAFGQFIQPSQVTPPSITAYISNSGANTVSAVDLINGTVTIPVGNLPYGIAVSADYSRVYVTNKTDGTVSVIVTATNSVMAILPVGTHPFAITISPSGNFVYVVNQGANSISIINTLSLAVSTFTASVGNEPTGIAVTPNNEFIYVTNFIDGTVSIFTAAGVFVANVTVNSSPVGIVISPDGTKAFVANQGANSITVIDTSTYAPTTFTTGVGNEPTALALNHAGTVLYVTNYSSGNVSVFNASTHALITTITVGTSPYGISFTSDGTAIYVVNYGSNTISIINASTNIVSATIPLTSGSNPVGFGQFIQPWSIPLTTLYVPPQGRLTLTSGVPVMTADATGVSNVYYTPYQGNIVPIYDGANMNSYAFGQLTMALSTSNQLSGKIYDLFVFLNSGVITIGAGPAWSSPTSRGTGAGTTQLQQIDGLWVNANTITLTNGATSYSSIPVGEATYVGSVYMTASGQTAMSCLPNAAAGGTNNFLGVWNAYNRVSIYAQCKDNTASWSYSTNTARPANNSNSNRITFLDGLAQSNFEAEYSVSCSNSIATGEAIVGIGINSNTSLSVVWGQTGGNITQLATGKISSYPLFGLTYLQAMEQTFVGTQTFDGSGAYEVLLLRLEM